MRWACAGTGTATPTRRCRHSRAPATGVRRYLETQHPHLLKAYDPEFLAHAVEARKPQMSEACSVHFDWAQARAAEVGI
jgi:hypothetical protein